MQMMEVHINGKIEMREVDYFERTTGRCVPKLLRGESAVWTLYDPVPFIAQDRYKDQLLDQDDES